jgi:hypothetical protein
LSKSRYSQASWKDYGQTPILQKRYPRVKRILSKIKNTLSALAQRLFFAHIYPTPFYDFCVSKTPRLFTAPTGYSKHFPFSKIEQVDVIASSLRADSRFARPPNKTAHKGLAMPNKIGLRTVSLVFLTGLLPFATLSVAPSIVAAPAQISVGVSVGTAPPPLPVYTQPPCPGENYIWTPGYWAWDGEDYYWVPGTWVEAPDPGLFWTPGYWAWENAGYVFVPGYWGPTVGFYGGIDYGFGYTGHGYYGGRWNGGHFYYNTAVNNVNVRAVHNTYVDHTVVVNNNNRASFNGGNGGVQARATAQETAAARSKRMGAVAAQTRQVQDARSNRVLRASYNHGAPPVAATPKAGTFSGSGVVAAHNAPAANQPANRPGNAAPANRGPANNGARPNPATRPNPAARPNNAPPTKPSTTPNENQQRMERQPSTNHAPMTPQNNAPAQRQQMRPQQHPQPTQQRPQEPQRPSQHQSTARPAPQVHEQAQPHPAPQQHAQPHAQPQPHEQAQPHGQPKQHEQPQRQDQH